MRKGSRYVHQTKYNILFIITVLMACVTAYVLLGVGADAVKAWNTPLHPLSDISIVEIEVDKPVPVPWSNCKTEKCKILAYIVDVFQDDSADAITMVRKCENSTFEMRRGGQNSNGTYDWGTFQINEIHVARYGDGFKTDWKENVDVAYQIFLDRGWTAWSCSHVVGVRSFWQ